MEKESNLAIIEFKSVARGIYVTDAVLKSASVNLVLSTSLCPGKYLTIVEGETGALENALKTAEETGGMHVFSIEVLNAVNSEVIAAISGRLSQNNYEALAIIESMHMASLISSADDVIDAVPVEFVDFRLARGCGVNSFYIFSGDYSSVAEGARRAEEFLKEKGALLACKVLSGPDREVYRWIKTSLCRC